MTTVLMLKDYQGLIAGQLSQFTAEEAQALAESGHVEIVKQIETKKGK